MPYKSAKQAAYMHIHLPAVAKQWDREMGRTGVKDSAKKPPVPKGKPAKKK